MNLVNLLVYLLGISCADIFLAAFNVDFDNEIKIFDYEHNYEKLLDRIKMKNGKYNDDSDLICTIYKRGDFIILSNCYSDNYEEFVQKTNDYQKDKRHNENFKHKMHAHDNSYLNKYYDTNKYNGYNHNYGKSNKREILFDSKTNDFFGFNDQSNQYQMKPIVDCNYKKKFKKSISYKQPFDYEINYRGF